MPVPEVAVVVVPVVAVPPAAGGVPPVVAVPPAPTVHEPVVGVATGAVEVMLGVVMTSAPEDADPDSEDPDEGSVVRSDVVSVRPCVEDGTRGLGGRLALTGTVAVAGFLVGDFLAGVAIDFSPWWRAEEWPAALCVVTIAAAIGLPWIG